MAHLLKLLSRRPCCRCLLDLGQSLNIYQFCFRHRPEVFIRLLVHVDLIASQHDSLQSMVD